MKKPTLSERLRKPIDASGVIIDPFNDVSNMGLRVLADKLDAIGRGVDLLLRAEARRIRRRGRRRKSR